MKIKFLQVHTFYDAPLRNLYNRYPDLKKKEYRIQLNEIIKDGFSAIHLFAPYFNKDIIESDIVIANCLSAQLKWLNENYGEQNIMYLNDWVDKITLMQVEKFKPDVLYLSNPIRFDSKFIRKLSFKPKLIIGWRTASIPEGTDWSEFDLILSFHDLIREKALKMGVKAVEHFTPGYPEWINKRLDNVHLPTADVIISGTWSEVHKRRNSYWKYVSEKCYENKCFQLKCYFDDSKYELPEEIRYFNNGEKFGIEMHKTIHRGKINLNAGGDVFFNNDTKLDLSKGDSVNMRLFEVTGSGAFLLTEHHDNLYKYFEPQKEIETFNSKEELIDKIKYYLKYPEKRKEIAQKGQERCLGEYSMSNKINDFTNLIFKYLS